MTIRRILVASDLERASHPIHVHATALARSCGARVTVVYVDEFIGDEESDRS